MNTVDELREEYAAWRESAKNAGFFGNFNQACHSLLRARGFDPRSAPPDQWVKAAEDIYWDLRASQYDTPYF